MRYFRIALSLFAIACAYPAAAQRTITLTLHDAIEIAKDNSPTALAARHNFRSAYWQWRSHQADQRPSLVFSSGPSLNRAISSVTQPDGSETFLHRDQLSTDGMLSLKQNIPFLGGSLSMNTSLSRMDLFSHKTYDWMSTPVSIGYTQSNLFGYNDMKWQRRIKPLRYRQAMQAYVEAVENIASATVSYFFSLAAAQSELDVATENIANAEKNFTVGEGRYNIGTITEEEMMQLEIKMLSEQTNQLNAQMRVDDASRSLRNFLGITGDVEIVLITEDEIPQYAVDEELACRMALTNNSKVVGFEVRELEAHSSVAQVRSNRGFQAGLSLRFGLTQTAKNFSDLYNKPSQSQVALVTLSIPILDWGKGKGSVKMAESSRDYALLQLEQDKTDFRLNVIKTAKQFNMQYNQITIAHKRREIANRRHDIAQRQYQLGKMSMTDLTSAIADKDNARAAYVNALRTFWDLHFDIRNITGYDFLNGRLLEVDFEEITK